MTLGRRGARGPVWALGAAGLLAALLGVWAAFAPLPPGPREIEYVIPKGTGDGSGRPGNLGMLPVRLHLTVGLRDILIVKNNDDVEQRFGPVLLAPGQIYRLPFHTPGRYQFACTASEEGGHIGIIVDRAPDPGWDRLRWRVEHFLGS
jgi:hypothetical protein